MYQCRPSLQASVQQEYQKHGGSDGVLLSKHNILVTLNTDGISMYKSSAKYSLWPVLLTVNELPPKLR